MNDYSLTAGVQGAQLLQQKKNIIVGPTPTVYSTRNEGLQTAR